MVDMLVYADYHVSCTCLGDNEVETVPCVGELSPCLPLISSLSLSNSLYKCAISLSIYCLMEHGIVHVEEHVSTHNCHIVNNVPRNIHERYI